MDEGIAKFIEKTCGFPELVPQLGKTRRTISKMPTHTHNGIHKGGPAAEGGRPTFVEAAEGRLHYGVRVGIYTLCVGAFGKI